MRDPRASHPLRLLLAVVVAATLLLAGCGGSSADPDGGGAAVDAGSGEDQGTDATGGGAGSGEQASACGGEIFTATVCAEIAITGAASLESTAASTVPAPAGTTTCSTWAEGADDELELPLFLDGAADGTAFAMESLVTEYAGPGSYDVEQLSGRGSKFTIVVGDQRFQPSAEGTSSATLTVDADGGGSLSAAGFVVEDGSGGVSDPIDAEITWTCTDA